MLPKASLCKRANAASAEIQNYLRSCCMLVDLVISTTSLQAFIQPAAKDPHQCITLGCRIKPRDRNLGNEKAPATRSSEPMHKRSS
ncbi:hypothetical protein SKAU_G00238770 [Synaphobranchus kaupii]|uniref:Uncharacterized protein n=1 Tax=Synaphobranchus kaupii TaxID=118154 RepID=A0A9Q1F7I9_SYNKA|nr:hypothetical protein SKAU_G00238770 [Synaphobranchus kaupii]